jgi:seryl-tRNA synthetase
VPDLPGLHRRQNLAAINLTDQKREYTLSVRTVQALNKKMNSLKGNRKKDARHQVNELKARMEKLLTKIGTYTPSERVHGFKEEGDAF